MAQTALTTLHLGGGLGRPFWSEAYSCFGPKADIRYCAHSGVFVILTSNDEATYI